jgi:3-oxoadipate enol-lactonase
MASSGNSGNTREPQPEMAWLPSRLVKTRLGRVRVRLSRGTGQPILMWPSLLMTGDLWAGQVAHFGDRYRLVLVDPPGHGGSEPLGATFSFENCGQCVVDLLDGLEIDKAHFVGNSWGGMIGATFAALHPSRVDRAVLMNCTASRAGIGQKSQYAMMLLVAQLLRGIRPPLTQAAMKGFLGPTTWRDRPQVVMTVRHALEAVDVHSVRWAVRSVVPARPDQHELLAQVRSPVLVVAGAEDTTFSVAETSAMADSIPGAAFTALDGVAHLAALEDPDRVNRLIEDFLFGPIRGRDE